MMAARRGTRAVHKVIVVAGRVVGLALSGYRWGVRTVVHLTYLAVCPAPAVLMRASRGPQAVGIEDPPLRTVGRDS